MSDRRTIRSQELVRNIDEALAQNPALTEKQLDDVRRLRDQLQNLCRSGKVDEAERCERLALMIIREGAPMTE